MCVCLRCVPLCLSSGDLLSFPGGNVTSQESVEASTFDYVVGGTGRPELLRLWADTQGRPTRVSART